MERLTKDQIKYCASACIPIQYVISGSNQHRQDLSVHMLFPPQLENNFPMLREQIAVLRGKLRAELEHVPPGNSDDISEIVLTICLRYEAMLQNLCGKEEYSKALRENLYTQEFHSTVDHNIKMTRKFLEYLDRACGACGKQGPWKRCSRCLQIYYCGVECQTSHWPTHKTNCISKLK